MRGSLNESPAEGNRRRRQTIAWIFVALIVVGLSFLVLGHDGPHREFQKVSLLPSFDYLRIFVRMAYGSVPTRRDIRSLVIDGMGNVAVFVPLGIALAAALLPARRVVLKSTIIGGLLSLSYEVIQYFIPGRVVESDDVVLNTAGAAIGAAVMVLLVRWLSRQSRTKQPAQPTSHD